MLKRGIDIIGALFGLTICAPLIVFLMCMIWLKGGRPILYREYRIGLHQQTFQLIKFRTMALPSSNQDSTVAGGDDPRILTYGHFLRRSHLDELPQLWHVLKGEMSLVGPRPYKISHFERLPETTRKIICSVKPGLTGSDALIFIAEDEALKGKNDPEALYLSYLLPAKATLQTHAIQTRNIRKDLCVLILSGYAIFSCKTKRRSITYLQSLLRSPHKETPSGHTDTNHAD